MTVLVAHASKRGSTAEIAQAISETLRAKHFLGKHANELRERPFWVFSSGPVGIASDLAPAAA